MKHLPFSILLLFAMTITAIAQVPQGTAMRSTNGIGFGITTIANRLLATNVAGTNHFAGTLNVRSNVVSQGVFTGNSYGLTNSILGIANVNEFGADPTGTTDSSAAIQAAVTYASTRNKSVWFSGTYLLGDTATKMGIYLPGSVSGMTFYGNHSTLRVTNDSDLRGIFGGNFTASTDDTASDIVIKDFILDCNSANRPGSDVTIRAAIMAFGDGAGRPFNWTVEDCVFTNMTGDGVVGSFCGRLTIDSCKFYGPLVNLTRGMITAGTGGNAQWTVQNCQFFDALTAVYSAAEAGAVVFNNTFTNCHIASEFKSHNGKFLNNRIFGGDNTTNDTRAVLVTSLNFAEYPAVITNTLISGNTFEGSHSRPIWLNGASDCVIVNNLFSPTNPNPNNVYRFVTVGGIAHTNGASDFGINIQDNIAHFPGVGTAETMLWVDSGNNPMTNVFIANNIIFNVDYMARIQTTGSVQVLTIGENQVQWSGATRYLQNGTNTTKSSAVIERTLPDFTSSSGAFLLQGTNNTLWSSILTESNSVIGIGAVPDANWKLKVGGGINFNTANGLSGTGISIAQQASVNEIPSGYSLAGGTTAVDFTIFPSATTAGRKIELAGYDGSLYRSVLEYQNVAAGGPIRLSLVKNAGMVGIGTTNAQSLLDVNGTALATALSFRTNTFPISPNFLTSVQLFATNAAFQFLPPTGVDTTLTQFQETRIYVTNNGASPFEVTAPANVHQLCTWWVTNLTEFKFQVYASKFTNAVAIPWF